MTCIEIQGLLPRYVDGRLPQDDLAIVRAHLAGCTPCGRERGATEQVDAVLEAAYSDHPFGDAGVEALVAALPIREMAARHAARPARAERPRVAPGPWAAAAAVALVAGGLLWGRPDGAPVQQPVGAPAPVLAAAGGGLMRVGGGDRGSQLLEQGTPVRSEERLVAVASPAWLTLPDGSRVDVCADTEVALRQDADGGLRVVLGGQDGEVYCEVARRSRPFRVAARGLEVQVLGTRFLVNQGVRSARLVVLEGRVLATSSSDRRVVTADEGVEARDGEALLVGLRVEDPRWGRWVPRVADELRRRFAPSGAAAPASEPSPLPKPVTPVGDPSLDGPIEPPKRD